MIWMANTKHWPPITGINHNGNPRTSPKMTAETFVCSSYLCRTDHGSALPSQPHPTIGSERLTGPPRITHDAVFDSGGSDHDAVLCGVSRSGNSAAYAPTGIDTMHSPGGAPAAASGTAVQDAAVTPVQRWVRPIMLHLP